VSSSASMPRVEGFELIIVDDNVAGDRGLLLKLPLRVFNFSALLKGMTCCCGWWRVENQNVLGKV
jgi:hypothetical protein